LVASRAAGMAIGRRVVCASFRYAKVEVALDVGSVRELGAGPGPPRIAVAAVLVRPDAGQGHARRGPGALSFSSVMGTGGSAPIASATARRARQFAPVVKVRSRKWSDRFPRPVTTAGGGYLGATHRGKLDARWLSRTRTSSPNSSACATRRTTATSSCPLAQRRWATTIESSNRLAGVTSATTQVPASPTRSGPVSASGCNDRQSRHYGNIR
jgi:hypothetical protein